MPTAAERRAAVDILLARLARRRVLTPAEVDLLGKHVRAERAALDAAERQIGLLHAVDEGRAHGAKRIMDARDRAQRRAEEAEAAAAETKRLLERRTATLRQRAEHAERSARRYRLAWLAARRDRKADRAAMTTDLATLDRVRALAADMRTWCSPHGIASQYADDIERALAEPTVTTTITADTSGLADALRAAEQGAAECDRVADMAHAEHVRAHREGRCHCPWPPTTEPEVITDPETIRNTLDTDTAEERPTAAEDDAHGVCPHGVCRECNGPCDACQPVTLATDCANPECEHTRNWHTGTPRGVCVARGGACPCEKFQPPPARR